MYYVYLLKSPKNNSLYIGFTSALKQRLTDHNEGLSYHTRKYRPWKLIYFEGYLAKEDAYRREKALKLHKQGLRRLKERLHKSLFM